MVHSYGWWVWTQSALTALVLSFLPSYFPFPYLQVLAFPVCSADSPQVSLDHHCQCMTMLIYSVTTDFWKQGFRVFCLSVFCICFFLSFFFFGSGWPRTYSPRLTSKSWSSCLHFSPGITGINTSHHSRFWNLPGHIRIEVYPVGFCSS